MPEGRYIKGVPQSWADFNQRYLDGTEVIYGSSSLSAAEKAAKYGFIVEKTGAHFPGNERQDSPIANSSLVELMMKTFDPHRYATDPVYKQGMDQMLQAAVKMAAEEKLSAEYRHPNPSQSYDR